MATTGTPPQSPPAGLVAVASFFRLTVEDYHGMIRNAILTPDDRVELLDGYLVNRMPQNPPHASCTQRLNRWLIRTAPPGWVVRVQLPVTLSTSEPEPDAAIARGDDHAFDTRHPQAADFGIVVEVANTSLILDRQEKGRLYAQSGIPVYWIINLIERIVEVYTDPDPTTTPPAYRTRTDYPPGQAVPIVLDGQTVGQIPVDDLLP